MKSGTYTMISLYNSKAVTVSDEGSVGGNVTTYEENYSNSQIQYLTGNDTDGWAIRFPLTGYILDLENGNQVDGANVRQWTWNGYEGSQKWDIVAVAGKTFAYNGTSYPVYTVNVANGTVRLDVNSTNGNVRVWSPKDNYAAQQWIFVPAQTIADGGTYSFVSEFDQTVAIDVPGGSTANNCRLQLWTINYLNPQIFKLVKNSDGSVSFVNPSIGKAITADDDLFTSGSERGAHVCQRDFTGADNQKWVCSQDGQMKVNGHLVPTYIIRSQHYTNMCLAVTGDKNEVGTELWCWTITHTPGKRWYLMPQSYTPTANGYKLPQPRYLNWAGSSTKLSWNTAWANKSNSTAQHGQATSDGWPIQARYRVKSWTFGNRTKSTTSNWKSVDKDLPTANGWGNMWTSNATNNVAFATAITPDFTKYDRIDVDFQAHTISSSWGDWDAHAKSYDRSATLSIIYKPTITVTSAVLSPDGLTIHLKSDFLHYSNTAQVWSCGGNGKASGLSPYDGAVLIPFKTLKTVPEEGDSINISVRYKTIDGAFSYYFANGAKVTYDGKKQNIKCWTNADAATISSYGYGTDAKAYILIRRGHGVKMERIDAAANGVTTVPYPLNREFDVWFTSKSLGGFVHTHYGAIKDTHFYWTWGKDSAKHAVAQVNVNDIPQQTRKLTASVTLNKNNGDDHATASAWAGTTQDMTVQCVDPGGKQRDNFDALAYTAGEDEVPVYRSPYGDWERVAISSVDISTKNADYDELKVEQSAVTYDA